MFPSNFVEVIETSSPTAQPTIAAQPTTITNQPANKLNIFGNKTSKINSPSASLNMINSHNSTNNNISTNNNLTLNNTQHQHDNPGLVDDSSTASSERRPKPIRGVGYGDMFGGKSKPLPADPSSGPTTERSSILNSLQKQIPKKPPPPAPTTDSSDFSADQAPALPPKPANQFSTHLQHHPRPLPATKQVRERARVVYEYEPLNDDELAMKVGDIIEVIDKDIEDAGWWKGELRGKIGVFPDNFVQLIEVTETQTQDWQHNRAPSLVGASPPFNQSSESKIKSVFAATPKGFSKELENNLEKHNNPASFLSLKRNKLQHQMSSGLSSESTLNENGKRDDIAGGITVETNATKLNHITANRAKGPSRRPPSNILNKRNQLDLIARESNGRENSSLESLPANPTSQSSIQHETLSSLPTGQHNTPLSGSFSLKPNDSSASIKPSLSMDDVLDNQLLAPKTSQRASNQQSASDKNKPSNTPPWMVELRKAHAERKRDTPIAAGVQQDESSTGNASESAVTANPAPTSEPPLERKSTVQALKATYTPTTTMTGAVKSLSSRYSGDYNITTHNNDPQRNSITSNNLESFDESSPSNKTIGASNKNSAIRAEVTPIHGSDACSTSNGNGTNDNSVPSTVNRFSNIQPGSQNISESGVSLRSLPDVCPAPQRINAVTTLSESDATLGRPKVEHSPLLSNAQYDDLLKQISRNVTSELGELKNEVKRLREDCQSINELKNVVELMKVDLKACQAATENQKRYIKELVNNLADERKKIASMQTEIDRNLK